MAMVEAGWAQAAVLGWYERHRRRLPWRAEDPEPADPYHVWLSEIMLQQTGVATVGPYFERFIRRWPGLADLAAAPLDDILTEWAGLGYYARARNLHRCARAVAAREEGAFPTREAELRTLPGIGPYTAAAIAAIAFGRPAAPVDGNIERILCRLAGIETPLPKAKSRVRELMAALVPSRRPGDFVQALMDIGALVCTPRRPRCGYCPLGARCRARAEGRAEELPAKAPKAEIPLRSGTAFWLQVGGCAVWLRRRPNRGLLGGMMEVPSTGWHPADPAPAFGDLPWQALPGQVRHTFTHFRLHLTVQAACLDRPPAGLEGGRLVPIDALGEEALPTLMRKVASHALTHLASGRGLPSRKK